MANNIHERNNSIINAVMKRISSLCPNSVDLIAIAGSFASGNYYEKSDLDLVIIRNDDKAKDIETCFIMDDIGYDIYTCDWSVFDEMSKYNNPYVTKLKQLDIIYTRNSDVVSKYKELQANLNDNMNDEDLIKNNISKIYSKMLNNYDDALNCESLQDAYKLLGKFMKNAENIMYLANKSYVSYGTKNIPNEISIMKVLSRNVINTYKDLINCKNINEIIDKMFIIINAFEKYMNDNNIEIYFAEEEKDNTLKEELKSKDLTGSYEELYSNFYNKLKYAYETNNGYLSFRTMVDAQEFFDEYSEKYNINPVYLLENYNPEDLKSNFAYFCVALDNWKDLYNEYGKKINVISNISELYDTKRPFLAYKTDSEKEFDKVNQNNKRLK